MRKVNKILMATVAILLTLVLISTSVVSGIFARFVIKKQASTVVGLERFGVGVTITPNADLNMQTTSKAGDSETTVTINKISMRPGTNFSDALKIEFTGAANVDARVSIDFCFQYKINEFNVPKGVGGVTSNDGRNIMPIGLTFGYSGTDVSVAPDYINNLTTAVETNIKPYHVQGQQNLGNYFSNGVLNVIDLDNRTSHACPSNSSITDYYVYKDFTLTNNQPKDVVFYANTDTNKTKPINTLIFGFHWPKEYSDPSGTHNYDIIGTYLAQKASANMDISLTFTVRIEQI